MKITIPALYPVAIVADTAIMKDAPMPMLTAGFGDIIGKYTALADWRLARDVNGEYYCDEVVELVEKAVEKCAANAAGLCARDEEAVRAVTEALILSGIAIGLVGVSRPASGAEHHFSHYRRVGNNHLAACRYCPLRPVHDRLQPHVPLQQAYQ